MDAAERAERSPWTLRSGAREARSRIRRAAGCRAVDAAKRAERSPWTLRSGAREARSRMRLPGLASLDIRRTPPRAALKTCQLLEQRPRRRDPLIHVLHAQTLVGRVDVRVREREAGDDRRDPLVAQGRRRSAGSRPSGSAPAAPPSLARTPATRGGWPARRARPVPAGAEASSSTSSSAPAGTASCNRRRNAVAIVSGSWPGASRIDTLASARTGRTVFWAWGEPLSIPLTSSAGSAVVRT